MSPETRPDAGEDIHETVHRHLRQRLAARMLRGQPLLMDLGAELIVCRTAGRVRQRRSTTPSLAGLPISRRIMRFGRIVRDCLSGTLRERGLLDGDPAVLGLLAASAARLAGRLMAQLGDVSGAALDSRHAPDELAATLLKEGLRANSVATRLLNAGIPRIVERLQQRARTWEGPSEAKVTALRFLRTPGDVSVEWLTEGGASVCIEPLRSFCQSVLAPEVERLTREFERNRAAGRHYRQAGRDILQGLCPRLAEAVDRACRENKPVGTRLFTTRIRQGIPLDAWFHVTPATAAAPPTCVLSVHRAHRDFVLGAADGSRYYFPPCLLTARITVAAVCPRIHPATVRQPRGGHLWCHPYTGHLGADPFREAIVLGDAKDHDILYKPNAEAVGLFPNLAAPGPEAHEGNMCLSGQHKELQALQDRLHEDLDSGREPDVLRIVTAIHNTTRLGLTRGHQNNSASPLIRLQPTKMPYPFRGRPVPASLARRTFPFSPQRATSPRSRRLRQLLDAAGVTRSI